MPPSDLADFEMAAQSLGKSVYHLRLYVSGITPRSTTAIANVKRICEEELPERYDLEIIDIYQQPNRARQDQIVAVPTLVKMDPMPVSRLVGDMSDRRRVLKGLSL